MWSGASEIAVRMTSRRPGAGRPDYLADLRERLRAAIALRRELVPEAFAAVEAGRLGTSACRIVFSEADDLPGIVIDRYAELAVVQLLVQGTAQPDVRDVIVEVLGAEPWLDVIVERSDARIRELERLEAAPSEPLWVRPGTEARLQTAFAINDLAFEFDAAAGQKTGAFLDQRLNYRASAKWAERLGATGRALDVCTYQGGFALHLARVCARVTGVDASRASLEAADRNLARNAAALRAEVDWVEADAFELLRDWQPAGERFDAIVLDPPAFAKTKRAAEGALRGYKELNLRAMKMLGARPHAATPASLSGMAHDHGFGDGSRRSGGLLVTCSCSYHVSLAEFVEVIRAAAVDAGRKVQILETRGAAPDHPAMLTLPETSYLKCVICRVE
jgi:23S rRNA (cytosine1962-C5)-methyltransferase